MVNTSTIIHINWLDKFSHYKENTFFSDPSSQKMNQLVVNSFQQTPSTLNFLPHVSQQFVSQQFFQNNQSINEFLSHCLCGHWQVNTAVLNHLQTTPA